VPGVESVSWNWQEGIAYVLFASGQRPDEETFRTAIEGGTRFKMGAVRHLQDVSEFPIAVD